MINQRSGVVENRSTAAGDLVIRGRNTTRAAETTDFANSPGAHTARRTR